MSSGEYRAALGFAERFRGLTAKRPDPADRPIADRMIGTVLHYVGDQRNARRHIERMLRRYVDPLHRSHEMRFVWDQRVVAEIVLAVILWLLGFPDQAMRTARRMIESAQARDHTISLCYALAHAACPVALWVGDLARAARYVSMLLDHSAKLGMAVSQAEGRCFIGKARDGGLAGRGSLFQGHAVDQSRRGRSWLAASPHCARRASPNRLRRAVRHFSVRLRRAWPEPGKSLRGSRRSTRRSRDRRAAKSVGASPSCCASKAS